MSALYITEALPRRLPIARLSNLLSHDPVSPFDAHTVRVATAGRASVQRPHMEACVRGIAAAANARIARETRSKHPQQPRKVVRWCVAAVPTPRPCEATAM